MKKVFVIIVVIALIVAAVFAINKLLPAHRIGSTTNVSVQSSDGIETTRTCVYVGATSKLYTDDSSSESVGVFLDIFDDVKNPGEDLAKLIDNNGFPYAVEYVAKTSSVNPARFLIKLSDGTTYWVEPWPSLALHLNLHHNWWRAPAVAAGVSFFTCLLNVQFLSSTHLSNLKLLLYFLFLSYILNNLLAFLYLL